MCGIAGAFKPGGPRLRIDPMLDRLVHRGPDGCHSIEVEAGALGTRRLAIVDIEGGRQPLMDPSGRFIVSMNGEVYNHGHLRAELGSRGVEFASASDTEVAAAVFAEVGVERGLHRLDGMFAMAILDRDTQTLHLVRDRLGQKPLYWTRLDDGTLLWGSELKALLVHSEVRRELDPIALEQLLLFEYVPAPRTIYRSVHKLEPATRLEYRTTPELTRWWTPPAPETDGRVIEPERWVDAVGRSLEVSCRQRTRTELPLALLLSGGVDSTLVGSMVTRWSKGLSSFSVGFAEASFDESDAARLAASTLGTEHHAIPFRSGELAGVLDAITAGVCEPITDGSLAASWILHREVHARGYKIALGGDGADEHFGGYPTYNAHRVAGLASRGRGLIGRVARRLPASTDNLSAGYKARRFSEGLGLSLARRNQVWLGAFLPRELDALLGRSPTPWAEIDDYPTHGSAVDRAMQLDARFYLGDGVLQKVDRASMLHSVECRAPFLDHRLIGVAAQLPMSLKVSRRGDTKVVLRRLLARTMPRELVERPKKGFGTPLGPWLAGPCRGLLDGLEDMLEGVIAPAPVRRLVDEHMSGHRDHRRRLWTLLCLGRWLQGPWGPG